MKKLFLFFIAIFILTSLQAQQTTAIGQVLDKSTGKPLGFASLFFEEANKGTYTDEQGRFSLELPQLPSYTVKVEHLGFGVIMQTFSAEQLPNLSIELEPMPIVMEEILVQNASLRRTTQSDVLHDAAKHVSQPRDIGDMFRDVPGFGVVKRGGYAMDPVFRSFRNEQLNVQYDGGVQVMHACPNRMDPITTHVAPEEVERVEIIKGPFSVRYGQTMGGILNVITTKPEHSDTLKFGGSVEGGYEFNGNSKLTRLSLNTAGRVFDLVANGSLRDFGDYKNGDGVEIPTSFKSYDYSLKAGFEPTKNQRIQLGWRQSFGRDILHAGLAMDTDEDNSSVASLDYVAKNVGSKLYSVTFKGFYSYVDHVMSNSNRPNFMMMEAVAPVEATTLGGKLELALTPNAKNQTYVGLDLRHLMRDGVRNRLVKVNMAGQPLVPPREFVDFIWQDAALSDWGLFMENRFFANGKLTLTAGARLDYVAASLNDPSTEFKELYPDLGEETELNFGANISANYEIAQGWNAQLALGRGTRTASMEERFINYFSVGIDAFEYVGNPMLNPEANHQAELSLSAKQGPTTAKASVFYSYITDYITAAVDSSLKSKFTTMPPVAKRFQNIDAATQTGFELEVKLALVKNFSAYSAVAYTYAENLDWNEPLAEITPFVGTLGLSFENKWLTTDLRGRFAAKQDRISTSFGEDSTPGFEVFDLRAAFRPVKGLAVGAAVLNVLDKNYYEHLNRSYRNQTEQGLIYEAGRNITLYGKYEF